MKGECENMCRGETHQQAKDEGWYEKIIDRFRRDDKRERGIIKGWDRKGMGGIGVRLVNRDE